MGAMRRWLEDLDLGHYAKTFADNDIDLDVLPELSDQDLKELGLSLGHRRKLLKAIAALAKAPAPSPIPRGEAERRQLTVMFCDLVGSTELSAGLDPEDMREVIRSYQDTCAGIITRFEGFVAKFMGDGVLAYFGWPRAHEDEAERAVRAGLALVEAVAGLSTPAGERLGARVGIATGMVVVGDLVGEGAAQEQAVVGDTPNLAARLQGVAQRGQVVIAGATRRLLGQRFDLTSLDPQALKGLAAPVEAFAVRGERALASRFEADRGQVLPMVGRDQELALLLERWTQAKGGEGQGVLLVGEAGIGKSRITRALLDELADEPHTRVRYQCSPYHTDSALWPVIQQLGHAAGLEADDSLETRLDKVEAMLDRADARESAPLIADLLGLDAATRYGKLDMVPQAQRVRTLDALVDQLTGLAAKQPALLVLEDAHWIDPTTLALIEQCLDRIAEVRALVVLTSRPDNQPHLAGQPHVTQLTLNRLGRAGVEAIVARVGGDHLPSETIDAIIARADGVPLFVEELTKAVLETGETSIPASLHDSLMARLDRIPEVKEIAQTAACIGRVFEYALLAAIAGRPERELRTALDQLATAELIFRRGDAPNTRYVFKHALVQDVAHQSLLKSKRRQLHARIAQVLEERLTSTDEPEVLARHLTDASLAERAIPYWRRAGELAAGRSADLEAIAHLRRGLALADSPQHLHEELALRLAIGGPLMVTKGYASPEVEENYSRASALCEQLDRSTEIFPVLRGLWNCYYLRGELQRAFGLADRLVLLADQQQVSLRRAHACRARGSTLFCFGRLAEASLQFEKGIALGGTVEDEDEHRAQALLHGEHPGVFCRTYLAWALWLLGYPDQALEMATAALDVSQRLGQPSGIAVAASFAGVLHNWRREFATARMLADTTIGVASEHHLQQRGAQGALCRGTALVGLGQQAEGIAQLRTGLANWNATGAHLLGTNWLGDIAEAHIQAGQLGAALAALDRAAETTAATGECHYQAELHRLRGVVLAETGENAEAASWLQRAIDTARHQQARSLELRAATSLARLWLDQGKRTEARDLLAPIYGWFTEGFGTLDLIEAKALLAELESDAAPM